MGETVKERGDGSAELVKSVADKHAGLVRPVAKYYSAVKDAMVCGKGRYTLVKDVDEVENGVYDKPLPCFGCGIGWFS
jgi:histidyl-tRNA synthetase